MPLKEGKEFDVDAYFESSNKDLERSLNDLVERIKYLHSRSTVQFGLNTFGEQDESGIRINAVGGGTTTAVNLDHPWRVTTGSRDDGLGGVEKIVNVYPASIAGVVPTNIFDPQVYTGTGREWVIVTGTASGNAIASASISVVSTAPYPSSTVTQAVPPPTVTDVIAVIEDGVVFQIRKDNTIVKAREVFTTDPETIVFGGRNYIAHYQWEVSEPDVQYIYL